MPEHYRADWTVDRDYKGSDMFRPYGVTPGHSLEWTRLACNCGRSAGAASPGCPTPRAACSRARTAEGWDKTRGGLYYTLEWNGAPRVRDRLWWPVCEGIGAATFLGALDGGADVEAWYRRLWDFAARRFIDRRDGGWRPQLDDSLAPIDGYFVGKPDLYHALQACLIPLYPTDGSLTRGILGETKGARVSAASTALRTAPSTGSVRRSRG